MPLLDADNQRRREIAKRYLSEIKNPLLRLPTMPNDELQHVWHVFTVFCDRRDELKDYLVGKEIQTVIHYPIPPHRQPAYTEWHDLSLPITEKIHESIISIPISPVLSDGEVSEVIDVLNAFK